MKLAFATLLVPLATLAQAGTLVEVNHQTLRSFEAFVEPGCQREGNLLRAIGWVRVGWREEGNAQKFAVPYASSLYTDVENCESLRTAVRESFAADLADLHAIYKDYATVAKAGGCEKLYGLFYRTGKLETSPTGESSEVATLRFQKRAAPCP